jgi:hypothetical protein
MPKQEKPNLELLISKSNQIILIAIIFIFFVSCVSIAINIRPGIIPDEEGHLLFSMHFSNTWGIPDDSTETAKWGWYIKQNPFLNSWINGRLINLITFLLPNTTQSQILIALRIVNVLYSTGTVIFSYLLSTELIQNKWWQILPVFLLTNTLMFVFLSSGVSYDNLVNFLSVAGIYFLTKIFRKKNFLTNSLAWILCISLGTLVKYTVLPLALSMGFAWIVYIFLNRHNIFPIITLSKKEKILLVLMIGLLFGNFLIYGVNLIRYQSLRPKCKDIMSLEQCNLSQFAIEYKKFALEERLTVLRSIKFGYPNPIEYITNTWIRNMLLRTYGFLGHQTYFPYLLINFYQFLSYLLLVIGITFYRPASNAPKYLISIIVFYIVVLLIRNYHSELTFGFRHFALQGRYIFPVIVPIYILFTKFLKSTPSTILRWAILIFTIGLFIYGGPLTFILKWDSVFSSWFF